MSICPKCGKEVKLEVCECGFNFNDLLTCPYKISNKCIHNQNKCEIYGLNFEDCKMYLHKSGIII